MPQLKVSFNHNHSLTLPDNNAKSFGKQNIWAQPKLIGTLLQSSETNTIKKKVRSLGRWGRSDEAGDNKKRDLFSLYVLFSHFTSYDATLKNSFFQMSSLSMCKCTHNLWKNKRKIPMRISRALKWENITYKPRSSIGFWQIMTSPLNTRSYSPSRVCMNTNIFCYFIRPSVSRKLHTYLTSNYLNPLFISTTDCLTWFSACVL